MSRAYLHGFYNGRWVPVPVGPTGRLFEGGAGGMPDGEPGSVTPWSYAAASGGITNTSDVTLSAAPGAGRANYLTSLQVQNTSATPTEVVVKSGSTILWRCLVGASMTFPVNVMFERPLIAANNTALTAACITTATVTYLNAQGYSDASLPQIQAQLTSEIEIFDAAGNPVTTDSGQQIYLA